MKLNWGVGITIVIIVFTLAGLSFIYFAFHQDVNLVKKDYYQDEIKYQERIEEIKRTDKLNKKLDIKIKNGNIIFSFPITIKDSVKGNILLYRPSNRHRDISFPISLDSSNIQTIPTNNMIAGLWKAQVKWKIDSLQYYTEKILMVQ